MKIKKKQGKKITKLNLINQYNAHVDAVQAM